MPMGHISDALCLAASCSLRVDPAEAWRPRTRRRPAGEPWRLAAPVRAAKATRPGLRSQTTPAGIRARVVGEWRSQARGLHARQTW